MSMKNFLLIPDSFKGTMSSAEICEIMARAIVDQIPDAAIRQIPVADGGEGSVDAFLKALGGDRVNARVKGPFFEELEACYGLVDGGDTAVVEIAACAGLPLVDGKPNPALTTTFGVGQLILDAAKMGAKKIIVGLGGSATNDGGCGAAAAVGVRFFDEQGSIFIPTGGTLANIRKIDTGWTDAALNGVEIVTMCDIDNPLFGPEGAAYIFGPQKGADAEMVGLLDMGLRNLDVQIRRSNGMALSDMPGAGAAGGMGAGMAAFFNSKLCMGIDVVLDAVRFNDIIADADMVLTGEGKIDGQSLRGKVVIGVARRAKAAGVPVVAIVGDIANGAEDAFAEGVCGIFSINRLAEAFSESKLHAREDLAFTVKNVIGFCTALENRKYSSKAYG